MTLDTRRQIQEKILREEPLTLIEEDLIIRETSKLCRQNPNFNKKEAVEYARKTFGESLTLRYRNTTTKVKLNE